MEQKEHTSSSEAHLSADDTDPESVTILTPFCLVAFIALLCSSTPLGLKRLIGLKLCCIFLGIREAGYISTKPGLFITFSLNLTEQQERA